MRPILLVEDDDLAARVLARFLTHCRAVQRTSSVEDACARLAAVDYGGVVVNLHLGKTGSGFDVVAAAALLAPARPVVIVTALLDRDVVNRAAAHGASFVCKPCTVVEMAPFLQRVFAYDAGLSETVGSVIERKAREWGLSLWERELLTWRVAGLPGSDLRRRDLLDAATYRARVAQLVERTGHSRMSDTVNLILRLAVGGTEARHARHDGEPTH